MNLKEQLTPILEDTKKRYEEEKRNREFPEPITRTDEDWEIISEYLRRYLMQYSFNTLITVKSVLGYKIKKKFIAINCESEFIKEPKRRIKKKILKPDNPEYWDEMFEEEVFGRRSRAIREQYERISLKDGKELEIYNEDMQRFCNQYNIKLAYLIDTGGLYYKFSTDYCGVNKTKNYLIYPIYPKQMLRTKRELDIINEHLENLMKKYACEKEIKEITVTTKLGRKIKKNCIDIAINNERIKGIVIENGEYEEYLDIYEEDILRFCNQHNFKLDYKYEYEAINSYCGKRKPIKYCIII